METVRNIAMSLLVCLVLTGVLSVLVPKSNMEKSMKFVISLFFLASIVYPFAQGGFSIDFSLMDDIKAKTIEQENLEMTVGKTLIDVTKSNVENQINNSLINAGVVAEKILVEINISQDNSIDITKVIIYIDSESYFDTMKARNIVENLVGVSPQIEGGDMDT